MARCEALTAAFHASHSTATTSTLLISTAPCARSLDVVCIHGCHVASTAPQDIRKSIEHIPWRRRLGIQMGGGSCEDVSGGSRGPLGSEKQQRRAQAALEFPSPNPRPSPLATSWKAQNHVSVKAHK